MNEMHDEHHEVFAGEEVNDSMRFGQNPAPVGQLGWLSHYIMNGIFSMSTGAGFCLVHQQ